MSRRVTNWVDGFVEYTGKSESPEVYRKWTALSMLGGALQRKCRLNWGLFDLYPNMYVVLVGPSGVGKTGAMSPGKKMLRELDVPISADAATR